MNVTGKKYLKFPIATAITILQNCIQKCYQNETVIENKGGNRDQLAIH